MSIRPFPHYIKGGDYQGYLDHFRQQPLADLIEYQRWLPEFGGGWPRSNHAQALRAAINEARRDS